MLLFTSAFARGHKGPSSHPSVIPAILCANGAEPSVRIIASEASLGYDQALLHCIAVLGRAHFLGRGANHRNERRRRRYQPGEPLWRRELTDGHRDANGLGNDDRCCGGVHRLDDRDCSAGRRLYDRVLARGGVRERLPVERTGRRREYVIGAGNIRRIVGDRNSSGLDQCPGLDLVSAGGSYGARALCRRDVSLLRTLARSRYGRRKGRLRIACCSGVNAW
jgi:hypothetical protein